MTDYCLLVANIIGKTIFNRQLYFESNQVGRFDCEYYSQLQKKYKIFAGIPDMMELEKCFRLFTLTELRNLLFDFLPLAIDHQQVCSVIKLMDKDIAKEPMQIMYNRELAEENKRLKTELLLLKNQNAKYDDDELYTLETLKIQMDEITDLKSKLNSIKELFKIVPNKS